jgi:hypothetical protein
MTRKQPLTDGTLDDFLRTLTDEELAWPLPWTEERWQQYEARREREAKLGRKV